MVGGKTLGTPACNSHSGKSKQQFPTAHSSSQLQGFAGKHLSISPHGPPMRACAAVLHLPAVAAPGFFPTGGSLSSQLPAFCLHLTSCLLPGSPTSTHSQTGPNTRFPPEPGPCGLSRCWCSLYAGDEGALCWLRAERPL